MNKYKKIKAEKLINFSTLIIFMVLSIYSFKYCELSNKYSINKIVIYGNNFIDKSIIENLVGESINNKNIFDIDLELINKNLINNEYIESSKIYTVFPNKISIIINEINPLALFENNNQHLLIDGKYNKINASLNSINYYSVPIISMENYNDKDISRIVDILKYINHKDEILFNSINEIIIKSEFSYIIIDDKTKVKLSKSNIENNTYKLIQFINDIKDKNNINTYKYINVSIPNQIIVKERKI